MEKLLRTGLILFGLLGLASGVFQTGGYLFSIINLREIDGLSLVSYLSFFFHSSSTFGIAMLCLFAAHKISPLRRPF